MGVLGEQTLELRADLGGGAEGFLVVDSTVGDASSGGLRVAEDLTLPEVAALAREMTLKFAFVGLPRGGAKSGLRIPPGAGPGPLLGALEAFGRHLGPVLRRGIYRPGMDLGCGPAQLAAVYRGAGLQPRAFTDTGLFTAIGALEALQACRAWLGSPGRPLRLAVEGFGNAARWLAARLPAEFAIAALSTAEGAAWREEGFASADLVRAREAHGDALIHHLGASRGPREAVFDVEVDVFVPSARTWSLTPERARRLRASAVVPLANAPYQDGADAILEARGTACLPGFAVNCGGVFGSSLHDSGVPLAEVERISAVHFRPVVDALLRARARGHAPVALAREVSLARLARRGAPGAGGSRLLRAARELALEGVPLRLRGARFARRFADGLEALAAEIRARADARPAPAPAVPA